MKIQIAITGNDFACIGIDEADHDAQTDSRIALVEKHGLVGGGILLGIESDLEVEFTCQRSNGRDLTLKQWEKFATDYHKTFPTFDGHIRLQNSDHLTREEKTLADMFNNFDA